MIRATKVENGIIRLPSGMDLPEGTEVFLDVPDAPPSAPAKLFADRYAKYIGDADDLPTDLSENLDHYVHGRAKP